MTSSSRRSGPELTGGKVLTIFVGFFLVVFAANGVFLYEALSTRTGVVANEPYRKGLDYNNRIAADERQSALGWTSTIELSKSSKMLSLVLISSKGEPVSGLAVSGKIGRPSTDREDKVLALSEQQPGRYEAIVDPSGAGTYVADLEMTDPESGDRTIVYRVRRRLWVEE